MDFYYPLTLGTRRPKPVKAEKYDRDTKSESQQYEVWREGLARLETEYEEHPEAQVLQVLKQGVQTQSHRFWLILGEPGAGKSTLLEAWFVRWTKHLAIPRLGLVIPVLVRLRELEEDFKQDSETLAERLWDLGRESRALSADAAKSIYANEQGRMFWPVWLLDGLDEVAPQLLDKGLYERVNNMPGLKAITCRTAVYQRSLGREADHYKAQEYEILGLKPVEQQTFLEKALEGDTPRAQELHERIQQNTQIRLLAANPLMLTLIAEVSGEVELPSSRAAFYKAAIAEMWNRKLARLPEASYLTEQRDVVLTELAKRMGLKWIEAPWPWVVQTARNAESAEYHLLIEGLKKAGILRHNPQREQFGFIHLTFQEFYLARALQSNGLQTALEQFWENPRYEETLGLFIALLFQESQYDQIDQGIQWLVKRGEETYRKNPHDLWRKRRSPLRVVLHLLNRSAVALERLFQTQDFLLKTINRSTSLKLGVAHDDMIPKTILTILARDEDRDVRGFVAENTNTPPEVLAALARDEDRGVRWCAAQNASLFFEDL